MRTLDTGFADPDMEALRQKLNEMILNGRRLLFSTLGNKGYPSQLLPSAMLKTIRSLTALMFSPLAQLHVTALLSLTLLLPAIARAEDDKVILTVRVATLHGDGAHFDGTLIENWDEIGTFVSWPVKLSAGELEVVVRQASGAASAGNSYQIEIAEQRLSGTVKDTGGWRMIQEVSLGRMRLDKAGEFDVILRPLKKKGQSVMNLAGISLRGTAAKKAELMIPSDLRLGEYFAKKEYVPEPLPIFEAIQDRLPEPVIDGHADWLPMYWKCWQLAFAHLKKPASGSPLVSNWLDEWFSSNIFQWDTCFMMMFARYGHAEFPFIQSLDNFYCLQRNSGYNCREYTEGTGREINSVTMVGSTIRMVGRIA